MLIINDIRAGQRITTTFDAELSHQFKSVKGNPFIGAVKTLVCNFTACGRQTYSRLLEKHGMELSGKIPWFKFDENVGPCVVVNRKTGELYLAGCNHNYSQPIYRLNGTIIAASAIEPWLKPSRDLERGLDFKTWKLEHLLNAVLLE